MEMKSEEDDDKKVSVLTTMQRPRQLVKEWGERKLMGYGVESIRDPWYFQRPVFNHLWQNLYLGVGEEGARSIERFKLPKQHLYYLSMLLHEALLKEDYLQAGCLMISISRNPQHVPEQIWKCGLEVLKKCSPRMMSKTLQFKNLMAALCPQYSNQMILDMAFHLLKTNNDLPEAYQYLTGHINNKKVRYDPFFHAYMGMFEYALWKLDINRSNPGYYDDYEAGNIDVSEDEAGQGDEGMHFYAKLALVNLKGVLEESGHWDVFVLKIVEMLDYYKERESAVQLLESYRDKNMDNPNSHRYLYWYLKKKKASNEKLFPVLKDLIALDPTSELAHDYIKMLNDKGLISDVIDLLFLRLDHVSCKDSTEDWKLLASYYKRYKGDSECDEWNTLDKHLGERETWWPKYHFSLKKKTYQQERKPDESELLVEKYKHRISRYFKKIDKKDGVSCDHANDFSNATSVLSYGCRRTDSHQRKLKRGSKCENSDIAEKRKRN